MRHNNTSKILCLLFQFVWNAAYHFSKPSVNVQKPSSLIVYGARNQLDVFFPEFSSRLKSLSINGAYEAISLRDTPPKPLLFKDLHLYTENIPTVNRFLLANPKSFLLNEDLAKAYGVSFERLFAIFNKYKDQNPKFKYYLDNPSEIIHDLSVLAYILPVIYLAEFRPTLGVLGLQLNARSVKMTETKDLRFQNPYETVKDVYPYYKGIRDKSLYHGGFEKKSAKMLMIHQQKEFPMNRKLRSLPGKPEFELYYSSEFAIASDQIITKDSKPEEFKFFQYGTQWSLAQLDQQCSDNMWFVFDAPPSLIFAEDSHIEFPLYSRIVNSLKSEDFESTLMYSNSPEVQKERQNILKASRQSGRFQASSIQEAGFRQQQESVDRAASESIKRESSKEDLFRQRIPTTPQTQRSTQSSFSPSRSSPNSSSSRKDLENEILDFDKKIKELTDRFSKGGGDDDFDDELLKRFEKKDSKQKKDQAPSERPKSNARSKDDEDVDDDMLDEFFKF